MKKIIDNKMHDYTNVLVSLGVFPSTSIHYVQE